MVIREMIFGSRKLCLAIMLGLLVGHASVALHTAAHASIDVGDCGICLSYGHLSKAVSVAPDAALPPPQPALEATLVRTSRGLQAPVPAHQRGPPARN
jgi:hypothetical protein